MVAAKVAVVGAMVAAKVAIVGAMVAAKVAVVGAMGAEEFNHIIDDLSSTTIPRNSSESSSK